MAVIARNAADAPDLDVVQVPRRPDGQPYRFEIVVGADRAYDDTADGLLSALVPGYDRADEPTRLQMRLRLAVDVQVSLQAAINAEHDLADCGVWERAVLLGARDTQPAVEDWTCPVPLVLVDYFYEPYPDGLPRPVGTVPAAEDPSLIWLSPEDPYDLLVSLHEAGAVVLNEAIEAVA